MKRRWTERRWTVWLVAMAVGAVAGNCGAREEVRECMRAETPEGAQFACPAWLQESGR